LALFSAVSYLAASVRSVASRWATPLVDATARYLPGRHPPNQLV
jgi:hypothetical protein